MHILVVDDSRSSRRVISKMIRDMQIETTEASNGREAMALLDSGARPDLVTLNWYMPEMDGPELIRTIRGHRQFGKLPLVMISGESSQAKIDEAVAMGLSGYIIKPCTPTQIANQLKSLGLQIGSDQPESPPSASAGDTPSQSTKVLDESPVESPLHSHGSSAPSNVALDRPIRVMVVDDSSLVRRVISSTLGQVKELAVVGAAADGAEGLEKTLSLRPDVILLDVEMPVMNGLEMLRELQRQRIDVAVVMFSSRTQRGAKTATEALLLGARDFVFKPGGTEMSDLEGGRRAIADEIVPKILALFRRHDSGTEQSAGVATTVAAMETVDLSSSAKPAATTRTSAISESDAKARLATLKRRAQSKVDLVVVGSSTGGPAALATILAESTLADSLTAPIVITQHMPELFTAHLAARLKQDTGLDIAEASEGEVLRPGMIRIAPGGKYHVKIHGSSGRLITLLVDEPPVNSCRPSADVLFGSAAQRVGETTLAVVLTGLGQDGTSGCQQIRASGGQVLAQDEATSVVWGMPGSVVRNGLADEVLPITKIGAAIVKRLQRNRGESP